MSPNFIHLRVHSEFSMVDGLVRVKPLVIDFRDGIYAKARIYESTRLGDEYQSEMVVIDAGYSLEEMA